MSAAPAYYPPSPQHVDPKILQPSAEFKRETLKVLGGIVFFIIVYILLFIAALALALLCAAGGLALVALKPMIVTIMLGLGLVGLGIMVVFFLLKFLFKRHKVDRSGLIEVTEKDHPKLYEFIRVLAKETQTSLPKRIYLSPDVNACVFYDSSFWSMFLPVRKNLQIGLGLVNAVNMSEFKAIIAHEFGHFSQRSMKLGSYVYNMNHIIFNMLFDNEGYEKAVESWGNSSNYFRFFAAITISIVKGIQWVLREVYTIVNKIYMSLSRQMEFHADTVSASVSGGNHLVTSLRRLEIAETTFNSVFDFYRNNFNDGLKPDNIYPQHTEVLHAFARFHKLPVDNGLPYVKADSFARFNKSSIIIKDQWASHPSTDDREQHLRSLNIETVPKYESPWTLFEKPEALQQEVTKSIFNDVQYNTAVVVVNEADFKTRYAENIKRNEWPAVYKGFFDGRLISKTDLGSLADEAPNVNTLEELLTEDVLALPYVLNGIVSDLQTLNAISEGHLHINSFEFNGNRYKSYEVPVVNADLKKQQAEAEQKLCDADRRIIAWFLKKVGPVEASGLQQLYHNMFTIGEQSEADIKMYMKIQECVAPLYQTMKLDDIPFAVSKLKGEEVAFRARLADVLNDASYNEFIIEDRRTAANEYLSKERQYFAMQTYIQKDIDLLNQSLYLFYEISVEKASKAKGAVLTTQLELIGLSTEVLT